MRLLPSVFVLASLTQQLIDSCIGSSDGKPPVVARKRASRVVNVDPPRKVLHKKEQPVVEESSVGHQERHIRIREEGAAFTARELFELSVPV